MINDLAVAADGTIFCITEALEFQYFSPKGERHTIRKGENYSSVLIAPDGKVWVATLEGNVYSYHPQTKVISREENAMQH